MGQFKGDYSRPYPGMYDEEKRYLGILPQKSEGNIKRPVVDADLMDHLLSQTHMLRLFMEEVLGSGAPSDGFKIIESGTPENNFKINLGSYYNSGLRTRLTNNTDYTSSGSHPNDIHSTSSNITETELIDTSANWETDELVGRKLTPDASNPSNSYTISANTSTKITVQPSDTMITDGASVGDSYFVGLSTPSGSNRTDTVYLDCYLDEVDKDEDANLLHDINGAIYETCNRLKIRQIIKVREGSADIPTNGEDEDGNYHWYSKLAEIHREAGNDDIKSAMIDDWRLDIKRAVWKVPDLDVGGGYGDVVDGGLSIDQEGNLETDGNATFDGNLKIGKKLTIGYDEEVQNENYLSFGKTIPSISDLPIFGTSVTFFPLQYGNISFHFTKGITIRTKDNDGNDDDTYLTILSMENHTAGLAISNYWFGEYGMVTALTHLNGSDTANNLIFKIDQQNPMDNNPRFTFTSNQSDTEVDIDGVLSVKNNILLNSNKSFGSVSYISFYGKGVGDEIPKLMYGTGAGTFNKIVSNRPFVIDMEHTENEYAELILKSRDEEDYRRASIKLQSKDLSNNCLDFNIEFGVDSISESSGGRPNEVNFCISRGDSTSSFPNAFRFSSNPVNFDDTTLQLYGILDVAGDRAIFGRKFSNKQHALTYIDFYDNHDSGNIAGGRITFDGINKRFDISDDLKIHSGERNEDTYLSIDGSDNYKSFLEIIGKSTGVMGATNRFRIYNNESVEIGSDANPAYVTFATRWSDKDFNGAGSSTRAIFRFQQRDNSDTVREKMARLHVDGCYLQQGNHLTIGRKDGVSPEAFLVFGYWNEQSQLPSQARMYLQTNKPGFTDWFYFKSGGTAGDKGLDIDGHLMMNVLNSDATNTVPVGKVTMWITTDGKIRIKNNAGQVTEFTGTNI